MQEIYENIFENSDEGMLIIKNGKFIACNQRIVKMLLCQDKNELLNTHPSEISPLLQNCGQKSFDKANEYMQLALDQGNTSFEWTHIRQNKEEFLVEITLTDISTSQEHFILAKLKEIGEEALLQRRRAEEFETIFNTTQIGLAIMDLDSNFLEFNKAHLQFSGFTREELLKRSCIDMSIPEDIPRSREIVKKVIREGFVAHYEKKCVNKYNKVVAVDMSLTLMKDKKRILISVRDITEKKLIELKLMTSQAVLYEKAHYDNLTKLPNRSLFSDRLEQSIKNSKRNNQSFALLFLDLDKFKYINDTYGHKFGDIYLQKMTDKVQEKLRESDTFARVGGDEFAIILNNVNNQNHIEILVEKIFQSLEQSLKINNIEITISVSIGIALYPLDATNAESLLSYSDMAMYASKSKGTNQYTFYDATIHRKDQENIQLEKEMFLALKNKEFIVYYQPQIDAITNIVKGVESLIRWNHPTRGLLFPDSFLLIAQKSNLIIEIDKFVMRQGMLQMVEWKKSNYTIETVSLNLSMRQLENEQCLRIIISLLEETGCKPEWIELEILENDMMQNPQKTIETLKTLKTLGIHLAIDDFGTGYSSLSYLKRFPINKLKIDRTFIRDLPYNEEDRVLSKTIIGLAKNLNLDVIAEGVETVEQKEFLLENSCNTIQGYLYSKPIPANELDEFLLKIKDR